MIDLRRLPSVVALAACACLFAFVGACTLDEPATYTPLSGEWTYEEQSVVSNTCDDALGLPDPLTTFLLDYDEGDEFQVELGMDDIMCEIDGTDFVCGTWVVGTVELDNADAILTYAIKWEGEFASNQAGSGHEVTTISCAGADCETAPLVDVLPCSRDVTFEVEFIN